jgi:hypothetical protein
MSLASPFIKTRWAAYAGGGLTADRATRAEQVSSEVSDKNSPCRLGVALGADIPTS